MSFQFHNYGRSGGFSGPMGTGIEPGSPHPEFPGCLWDPNIGDYVCDDGYTVNGVPVGGEDIPPGWQRLEVNGNIYAVPPGVKAWDFDGTGPMSLGGQEQFLINAGGILVGPANMSDQERQWLTTQTTTTDADIARWKAEHAAADAAANPSALDELKRIAKAGGAGAQAAIKSLADAGDVFAKIALMFGIGYGAVTIALAVGGGGLLLLYLKK